MAAIPAIVREVYDYRELLLALTYRDIRVKYKQAVMGLLWAFFMPTLAVAAGIIIQAAVAYVSGQPLNIEKIGSVIVRTLPFGLFVGILSQTSNGLLSGMGLASKIYFPRQIIPLSSSLGVMFDFTVAGVLVVAFFVFYPGSPLVVSWSLLLLPVLLAILVIGALGLGLIFGAANLFYRDVKYILNVVLQFGRYFSAVVLFLDQYPLVLQKILIWNPLVPVLEAASNIVLHGQVLAPGDDPINLWPYLGYSAALALALLGVGLFVFRRTEHLFAEVM